MYRIHKEMGEAGLYSMRTNKDIILIIFILPNKDKSHFRFIKICVLTNIYIKLSNRKVKILSLREYVGMVL